MSFEDRYKDKQLDDSEMILALLPPDYQSYLDSQQPKITTEENETWEQLPSF